jgi:hypothetical protein
MNFLTDIIRLLGKLYRRKEGKKALSYLLSCPSVPRRNFLNSEQRLDCVSPPYEIKIFCKIAFKQFNLNTGIAHIS